jgi:hypothetical protein
MKHLEKDIESPSNDPILPEVYTATVACIYKVDGKYKGMLTPEHLSILLRAFEKAKYIGLHDNIHLPPIPESCIGACGLHHTQRYCYLQTCKPIKTTFSRMLPPHIITALVTKENWHHPLTMTHSLNTGVNTQEIRPSGKMQRLLLQVNWFLYLPSHSP